MARQRRRINHKNDISCRKLFALVARNRQKPLAVYLISRISFSLFFAAWSSFSM
jgi:hypothetical protein